MSSSDLEGLPLIQTKLHRPLVPVDLVPRPQLTGWLDERRHRRLTLVSAPAGYGKSTLISSWLDFCNYPHTWLTLDEGDNDLSVFLTYFLEAIRIIFPDAANNTQALLAALTQPPIKELAVTLVNEINQLDQFFVLVLDDFEVIQENPVHDFLNEFLLHPPRGFHLVLCTRMDPPLSIQQLRAQSQLTEIRAQDLRFSVEESVTFLEKMLDTTVDIATVKKMDQQSEGWVTGLRLAALALRHRVGNQRIETAPAANNQYVTDYLMSEILDSQEAIISEWLVKTSVLPRFNAGLCEAVCTGESEEAFQSERDVQLDGAGFLKWLVGSNLFAIPLDDYNRWVRYHYLFRDFLQLELARRYDSTEISTLHARASKWFAQQDLIDDALRHALAAGDVIGAAQLVEQNRHAVLNTDQWYILHKWLSMLPDEIKRERSALMLARAWVLLFQVALPAIITVIETVEATLSQNAADLPFWGEVDFFRGYQYYIMGQSARSLEHLNQALEQIPKSHDLARGVTECYFAWAAHMDGQKEMAVQTLQQLLYYEDRPQPVREARLLGSLIFIHLLDGSLTEAAHVIQQLRELAQQTNYRHMESWSSYLQGHVHYYRNEMEQAVAHFTQAVNNRHIFYTKGAIDSQVGLMLAYEALGQSDKANEILKKMIEFCRQTNNPAHIGVVLSYQARLSLLRGDVASAGQWLQTAALTTDAGIMSIWIEVPRLTSCRVLITQGTGASVKKAKDLLKCYQQEIEGQHNTHQLIEILLLETLACHKQGQFDEAQVILKRVVNLAQPGEIIRPFIETGSEIVTHLEKLHSQDVAPNYIERILSAFDDLRLESKKIINQQSQIENLIEPLTNREFEILALLGERLSNKEIAAELYISVGTVQQHLNHIYSKLGVKGRRQAVAKATELALLPSRK